MQKLCIKEILEKTKTTLVSEKTSAISGQSSPIFLHIYIFLKTHHKDTLKNKNLRSWETAIDI